MKHTVSAIFKSRHDAHHAIDELVGMGVEKSEISVLVSEEAHQRHFAGERVEAGMQGVEIKKGDKAEEGAAAGAAIGGALGAIVASLAAVGVIVAPGVGLMVAGPVVAALAGAGAGGVTGGLVGLIAGMGVTDHEAKLFAEEIKNGSILVAVHSDRDKSLVKKVLEKNNGTTSKS